MTRTEQAARFAPIKAEIARLWKEGRSTLAIAKATGLTKNSVVGHAYRMDLPGRPSPIKRDGVRTLRGERPVPLKVVPTLAELLPAVTPPAAFVAIKPVRAVTRTPTPKRDVATCFWPIGDPGKPSFHSCDAEAESGKPYCAAHCRIAYVKARPLRDEAA